MSGIDTIKSSPNDIPVTEVAERVQGFRGGLLKSAEILRESGQQKWMVLFVDQGARDDLSGVLTTARLTAGISEPLLDGDRGEQLKQYGFYPVESFDMQTVSAVMQEGTTQFEGVSAGTFDLKHVGALDLSDSGVVGLGNIDVEQGTLAMAKVDQRMI